MWIYIYIYPVALRAISATVPTSFFVLCSLFFVPQGSKKTNPQSNNNYQKRRPKLTGNHEKVTPGGVPEALGGGLGTILVPRVARRRKRPENGLGDPPPRDPVGEQILTFCRFCGAFSCCFFECRFGRSPGSILSGFGEVFKEIFEHFFIIFRCEAKAAKCHSTLLFTVV
jgi:hypothetical protein